MSTQFGEGYLQYLKLARREQLLTHASFLITTAQFAIAVKLLNITVRSNPDIADKIMDSGLLVFSMFLMPLFIPGRGRPVAINMPLLALNLALACHAYPEMVSFKTFGIWTGPLFSLALSVGSFLLVLPSDLRTDWRREGDQLDLKHWLKARAITNLLAFAHDSVTFILVVQVFTMSLQWWWLPVSLILCLEAVSYTFCLWCIAFWTENLKTLAAPPFLSSLIEKSGVQNLQLVEFTKTHQLGGGTSAWVRSLGGKTVIGLRDDLLFDTETRIQFALAHELGHARHHDSLRICLLETFFNLVMFSGFAAVWQIDLGVSVEEMSPTVLLPIVVLLALMARPMFSIFENWHSRHIERKADEYAVHLLGTATGMIQAFSELIEPEDPTHMHVETETEEPHHHTEVSEVHPLISFITGGTHPSHAERLQTARRLALSFDHKAAA
ncbi:MAG: M48 family metalloprotease [Cyanobacteria bacterium SZAS LIN-5]|nr:M48 family metalloprotease [Cyanobacteria bacterium SZAS LIN-5]